MISIKQNRKPDLPVCQMKCDNMLHKKLNKYDLTSLMNSHETNLFIGKPKSGKTSLLYSFFKSRQIFHRVFHNIYIFQPSASRGSMKDDIFGSIPQDQQFNKLTLDDLEGVYERIKASDKKQNNCIIFDDMTAFLKNNDTLKLLYQMVYDRRHQRLSIFFLVQSYKSVPFSIRKVFSNVFVFRTSKIELEEIFIELVEHAKNLMIPISKIVFDAQYNYLMINTDSNRLFKCFDEILIEELK